MGLHYSYQQFPISTGIPSTKRSQSRHRPMVAIWITGPAGTMPIDGCIDSGSDDTIFPKWLADYLNIDWANGIEASSRSFTGPVVPYRLVQVTLRLCDGREECQWDATVGIVDQHMRWALVDHAGFLDYFTTELRGDQQQTVLTPNTAFPGRHTVFTTP